MKRTITCLTMALTLLALPCATFADASTGQTATQQDPEIQVDDSESILDQIVDAVADLLGLDDDGSDEPLENVHPPDWNAPDDRPEGDDHGWEDQNK